MRVLVVPGYYGFGRQGGAGPGEAGLFFRDQAIALCRAGHEVWLVHVYFDSRAGTRIEVTVDSGVRCIYVHAVPWPRFNSIRQVALAIRACRVAMAGVRPEVIHAHIFHAMPTAWALSLAYGIPYVVTEHSSKVSNGTIAPAWRLVARIGYRHATALISVSMGLAEALKQYTSRVIHVIPNVVRSEFLDVPLGVVPQRAFTFLSVGYFDPVKGWDVLLEAFARLDLTREVSLVLCGDDAPGLLSLIRNLGLQDRVEVLGRTKPAHVPGVMQACHCLVIPSRVETFGVVAIEALACGKPVIMTATDAATDIVRPGTGMIVPIADPDALASAMSDMVDRGSMDYDPVQLREYVRVRFSGSAVAARLLGVYEQAIVSYAAWRRER